MIGNDIVWLLDPHNAGRADDVRLMNRILSEPERALVRAASHPDRALWTLWAAKEAAYKAWSRFHFGLWFRANSYEVLPSSPKDAWTAGTVTHALGTLPVYWTHGDDWVHGVVSDAALGEPEACDAVGIWLGEESAGTRRWLAAHLQSLGWSSGAVVDRPPVYRFDTGDSVPVSLSHDGPYGAAAFPRLTTTAAS